MTDWDVIAPVQHEEEEDAYQEEEQYFEEDLDSEYGSYTESVGSYTDTEAPKQAPIFSRSRHADRTARRHLAGAGYRKPQICAGRDIQDAMYLYNEGCHSYSDRIIQLRESDADDLIPNIDRTRRDNIGGAGSKIIYVHKVRQGSFKKHRGNMDQILRHDKVSEKTDRDVKHYFDHVSHELMEAGCFVEAKYETFRTAALAERLKYGIGHSAEMNSLYCFWCYYLREHFSEAMYDEFLALAREDNAGGSHYGLECFFRFASYGLEMFWNENVYNDFQDEALAEYHRKNLYGLEKLKAFLVNQKYEFQIPTKPEVNKVLEQFPTLKSFKDQNEAPSQPSGQGRGRGKKKQPSQSPQQQQQVPQPSSPSQVPVIGGKKQLSVAAAAAKQALEGAGGAKEPKKEKYVPPTKTSGAPPPPAVGGHPRGRGRGRGGQHRQESRHDGRSANTGGWTFGRAQPASAPPSKW